MQRALDVDDDAGQAEAALLGGLRLLGGPLDLGFTSAVGVASGPGLEDEQPPHDAELGRGEPDAERVVHDRHHPLDLGGELGTEVLHRRGRRAQHRVAELADVGKRVAAALERLGVEAVGAFVVGPLGLDRLLFELRLALVLAHAPSLRGAGATADRRRPRPGARCSRRPRGRDSTASRTAATRAGARSPALTSSWRRSRPRRRKRGAGPSSVAPAGSAGSIRSASAAAARSASPPSSAVSSTRIRLANGG